MTFDIRKRLNERESVVFDDSSGLPADPPAGGLTALSAAAEGGALWLLVAAAMALRPELRTTARNGALAVLVASIGAHVLAAVVRRERPAGEELPAYQALKRKPRSS